MPGISQIFIPCIANPSDHYKTHFYCMKCNLTILLILPVTLLSAQGVTWSEHVAPIIYKHCTSCHRPGEIAPFSLTSYSEAVDWANTIQYVTEIRYMPPWKPDPAYGASYQGENYLSDDEINTIKSWVNEGLAQGDPGLEPPLPVFPSGSQVGTPDLVLSFAQAHPVSGNNQDEYRFFVIPTGLTQNRDLVSFEMRPGNPKVVHHALVWADTTGTAAALDAQTPEYGYKAEEVNNAGGGQENFGDQLPTYTPGARPTVFKHGMAQYVAAGSDLVVQVHYAPSSIPETDSSSFNLFFADEPATRYVRTQILLPFNLTNGPFFIWPDTEVEFHGYFKIPFIDVSLIGIMPHCHKLGKNWRVFAVTPTGDTIPLVHIPEWDFNWQGTYYFKKPVKLPKNSEIHAYATYDNTSNNPNNPYFPPQFSTWGEGTSDEMYYLPLLWVPYQAGDENLNLDDVVGTNNGQFAFNRSKLYPIAPNPILENVKIGFTLSDNMPVSLHIYDISGRLIAAPLQNRLTLAGEHIVTWDASQAAPGVYCISLQTGANILTQKVIKE